MKIKMEFDFSGYVTKNNLRCTDGRIIRRDAFKDNDGQLVPLVWQHMHNDPANILGHAKLENREDGVYAYGKLNDSEAGKNAKLLIQHKDITALSIYANQLVQKGDDVIHGAIREVSLVLAGANPEAFIDNVVVMHSDGSSDVTEDEAVIYTGLDFDLNELAHEDKEVEKESEESEETLGDVWKTLSEKQQNLVYAMIAQALADQKNEEVEEDNKEEARHSDTNDEDEDIEHSDEEGEDDMKKNVFNQTQEEETPKNTLSHSDVKAILADAVRNGSVRDAFLQHVTTYGIENVGNLFPEAKLVDGMPGLITRDMEWVKDVMSSVKHSPFSRIKSTTMDITAAEARARGYVKGKEKAEEVVKALKRVTTPTTVYKKQKMDRDDVLDITDFDVIAWIKQEMRMLLEEEIARAILISDGRSLLISPDDKISEENVRPIYGDDSMYAHPVTVANTSVLDSIDDIIRARKFYKGSGLPTLYVNGDFLTDMLLVKDKNDRYIYQNERDLATKLRVAKIVEVPVMDNILREDNKDSSIEYELLGIIVNLKDYVVGADKGGQVNMFDDFDIDYNQQKYLIETRFSGALVQPKSALVLERVFVDPQNP